MKLKEPSFKAVLATTAGVAIFLGIGFNKCSKREPKTEPIQHPAPIKGDERCERDKGEGDVRSINFDEESCGYCGDGIKQRDESKESCLADFHCGDGVCNTFGVYAKWVKKGSDSFSLMVDADGETVENCPEDCNIPPPPPPICGDGIIDHTEECDPTVPENGCPPEKPVCNTRCQCVEEEKCGNGKLDKREECDPAEKKDRCGPKKVCSSECKCEKISEKCPPETIAGARVLRNNIASRMRGSIYNIRGALGVDPAVRINAMVTIEVQPSGSASILNSYATCDGKKCPKDAKTHLAAGISSTPGNLPPVYGSEGWCTFSFSVHFPPG